MASITVCAACRQVLRRQSRQLGQSREFKGARTPSSSTHHTPRLFTTSRLLSASQATPRPYQPKPPPVNPGAGEGSNGVSSEGREVGPQSTAAPGLSIAKELHKRVSSVTETYVAYGVCENLVKECARQADYTIPQAHEQNVEIPKTKDGEDLGVGTGWWFESKPPRGLTASYDCSINLAFSPWSHTDLQYLGSDNFPSHVRAHLSPTLFPSYPCSSMAPTSPGPFLLHGRRPNGHHP